MILTNPTRDFFCRAVMHAKQLKLRELGHIEADIMVLEESLLHMQRHKADDPRLIAMAQGMQVMKDLVREKKRRIL